MTSVTAFDVNDTLDVAIGDVRLVAAHSRDLSGALAAGARAAFVARPGGPQAARPPARHSGN